MDWSSASSLTRKAICSVSQAVREIAAAVRLPGVVVEVASKPKA
jgi:hypothetical protein